MATIIEMPIRNTNTADNSSKPSAKVINILSRREDERCEIVNEPAVSQPQVSPAPMAETSAAASIDFSVWLTAPKERTTSYFPTYAAVSRAMQAAMRSWVREWFYANPEVLLRPHTAYPILVFQCTHPFYGRPSNTFTYDIQNTTALNRAFASAASKLGAELKILDTKQLPWLKREHYFAYRSKEVVKYVMKNRRAIYGMLNVETLLMNSILKFALIDIPKMGLEEAVAVLRRTFEKQLHRFSSEFDLSSRVDQLLAIATEALSAKTAEAPAASAPKQGNLVAMPKRAEKIDLPLAA